MAKSLQAQINELRRIIENHHQQHKNLKRKVSDLARRVRTVEPFLYSEDRELFYWFVQDFLREMKKTSKT